MVELLTIGDEILYGQIVDTNAQWMSAELDKMGFRVIRKTSVGDNEPDILNAFTEAESRADIVLITGGLGPTSDDLTKPCLVKYFDCPLILNEQALNDVTEFFKSRGRELTEINRQQAMLPSCCTMISNPVGTAPGMWFEQKRKVFVSMPGVPHEMKRMMTDVVLPKLKQTFQPDVIHHHIIRTIGIGESFLSDKIKKWESSLPIHIKLAYLPSLSEVKLRLTATGDDKTLLSKETSALADKLLPMIGEYIYGDGDDPIEKVIGKILREKNLTLATAESCTGGYIAHLLTTIPGSSDYFKGSVVAYSNDIKTSQLGVSPSLLRENGVVSAEVVAQMANGVRERFQSSIGVSTSGIAGPDGGTPEKPVGTVWIAYSDGKKTETKKLQLTKDRLVTIKYTATAILNMIRLNLK